MELIKYSFMIPLYMILNWGDAVDSLGRDERSYKKDLDRLEN